MVEHRRAARTVPVPELEPCANEPIHVPGSIQPHGLLLVANAHDHATIGGAGDIERRLGPDWLGRSLDDLLGQDVGARIRQSPEREPVALDPVRGPAERFDAVAHRVGDLVVVELEPAPAHALTAVQMLLSLETATRTFERATGLDELCQRAAAAFRRLTGFDRVMVYRFHDDGSGVVEAEDRVPDVATFLNHRFPASDIPQQARALYVRNRVRIIPQVGYVPAVLRPAKADLGDLDLSDVALRSVSPIHIRYLANMGVAASASVSIVMDGVLWGLIACHHASPRFLARDLRLACDALAGGLARQIRALDEAEHYRERLRLRQLEDAVVNRLGKEMSLDEFIATAGDELCGVLAATGFATVQGDEIHATGRCPLDAELRTIAAWVRTQIQMHSYSTHELAHHLPAAAACRERASGVLATIIAAEQPTLLLWFRPEQIEVVNWAGNPHKLAPPDPSMPLSPRASFATWSEAVAGRSQPWTLLEVESANRLTRAISEARQNRRVRDLNRDLVAMVADNERLLMQKDYLLREVSHRTQNSLQLVSSFLALQARGVGDATVAAHLGEAQRRLAAVSLVHRRLYGDSRIDTVDLARYLQDLCDEIRQSLDAAWHDQISLRLTPVTVSADRAVKIGLIVAELVTNANKYAYGGVAGPISITLERLGSRLRLIVADQGTGRSGARQGFGARMLAALVEGMAGELEEGSNDPGLRVVAMAPID